MSYSFKICLAVPTTPSRQSTEKHRISLGHFESHAILFYCWSMVFKLHQKISTYNFVSNTYIGNRMKINFVWFLSTKTNSRSILKWVSKKCKKNAVMIVKINVIDFRCYFTKLCNFTKLELSLQIIFHLFSELNIVRTEIHTSISHERSVYTSLSECNLL